MYFIFNENEAAVCFVLRFQNDNTHGVKEAEREEKINGSKIVSLMLDETLSFLTVSPGIDTNVTFSLVFFVSSFTLNALILWKKWFSTSNLSIRFSLSLVFNVHKNLHRNELIHLTLIVNETNKLVGLCILNVHFTHKYHLLTFYSATNQTKIEHISNAKIWISNEFTNWKEKKMILKRIWKMSLKVAKSWAKNKNFLIGNCFRLWNWNRSYILSACTKMVNIEGDAVQWKQLGSNVRMLFELSWNKK